MSTDAADMSRTCRKTFCAGCGRELGGDDIVKGYEADEGPPVLLTKDDFKQIRTDSENYIMILYSTALSQISPVYFSTSYMVLPGGGSENIFELLRQSLTETQKILVGRAVQGGIDALAAILPAYDGLLMIRLFLESELNRSVRSYARPPVLRSALDEVKSRLLDMTADFDLSVYENEYQSNLRSLIAAKLAAGQAP